MSSKTQTAYLVDYHGNIAKSYPVSTAKNGIGNSDNSEQTQSGTLEINHKIGGKAEKMTVLKGKRTQDITNLKTADKGEDNITSRILTLRGLGRENQNTENRQIYFHGTDEEFLIGQPASYGYIRMKNDDIIELFSLVKRQTKVQIA